MAKTLFLKGTCSQQGHYLSAIILSSPPKTSSVSKTMAVCSSFSPLLPSRFRRRSRPTSYLSRKPQFFVSYKAFSAQANTSTTKDEMPACLGFLGRGIMDSPMAQNLIKAGYKASPEEVAASCDVTFAMLADPQSALDVAYGNMALHVEWVREKGILLLPLGSYVDGATSKSTSEQIKAIEAQFLEAPVLESKKPAED